MSKEAMKLALEALEHLQPTTLTSFYTIGDRDKAITALREALAEQPAQPSKPWVGLKADELRVILDGDHTRISLALAIEAKLKEKNT